MHLQLWQKYIWLFRHHQTIFILNPHLLLLKTKINLPQVYRENKLNPSTTLNLFCKNHFTHLSEVDKLTNLLKMLYHFLQYNSLYKLMNISNYRQLWLLLCINQHIFLLSKDNLFKGL